MLVLHSFSKPLETHFFGDFKGGLYQKHLKSSKYLIFEYFSTQMILKWQELKYRKIILKNVEIIS